MVWFKVERPSKLGGSYLFDEFLGVHEGLITAEVDFESEEEALSFTPPVWFGEDVTYDVKCKNSCLIWNKLF